MDRFAGHSRDGPKPNYSSKYPRASTRSFRASPEQMQPCVALCFALAGPSGEANKAQFLLGALCALRMALCCCYLNGAADGWKNLAGIVLSGAISDGLLCSLECCLWVGFTSPGLGVGRGTQCSPEPGLCTSQKSTVCRAVSVPLWEFPSPAAVCAYPNPPGTSLHVFRPCLSYPAGPSPPYFTFFLPSQHTGTLC